MGKTIERLAKERGHTIVYKSSSKVSEGTLNDADTAIEFSIPETAVENIKSCLISGIPVVSGTTGWLENYNEVINFCQESNGSFIYASNFSIGVNLFFNLNEQLAKLMSGNIVVTSTLGQGSVFSLTLPCQHNNDDDVFPVIAPPRHEVNDKFFKGKILLAEDHDDNRRLIARLLTSLGLDVFVAKNGTFSSFFTFSCFFVLW